MLCSLLMCETNCLSSISLRGNFPPLRTCHTTRGREHSVYGYSNYPILMILYINRECSLYLSTMLTNLSHTGSKFTGIREIHDCQDSHYSDQRKGVSFWRFSDTSWIESSEVIRRTQSQTDMVRHCTFWAQKCIHQRFASFRLILI